MFRSLRSRLWLTYAAVIAVVIAIIALAIIAYLVRNPLATRQATLQLRTAAGVMGQRERLPLNNPSQLEQAVTRSAELLNVRILLQSIAGDTLVDSNAEDYPAFPKQGAPPFNNGGDEVLTIRDSENTVWLYISRRLPNDTILIVATPRPRATIASIITDDLFSPLFRAAAVSLLLSLVFAYLISRWVASPLQRMSVAALALAGGELKPIQPEGPKEVQNLGHSINEMVNRVHASQQSQRDFVANVSHELKTPLTSIQGFAQAILDGTANSPEAVRKSAQVISDESGRMHRLVVDLLALARMDAGTADFEHAQLDLGTLLRGVAERFEPQSAAAQVTLHTDIGALPAMIGDADRLSQVFTNLVDNALKHTPANGEVTLSAVFQHGQVVVRVTDNGPGIPSDELLRIFERFYQVDKARSGGDGHGAGLGLAIAREIIAAHGGEMFAVSEEGKGSTFTVKLPVARPDDTTLMARKN